MTSPALSAEINTLAQRIVALEEALSQVATLIPRLQDLEAVLKPHAPNLTTEIEHCRLSLAFLHARDSAAAERADALLTALVQAALTQATPKLPTNLPAISLDDPRPAYYAFNE